MTQDKSFKASIVDNVEIPDLNITDWSDITDVQPHNDEVLLTRFGNDAAKVRQLLDDQGLINFDASDLEYLLTDTSSVELKEISIKPDDEFNSQDIIILLNNLLAEYPEIKAFALIFTCNPNKPLLTLHKIIELEEILSRCYWGVQYNDTFPINTLNITIIITR